VSNAQEAQPLTGKAKGWANLKPWRKGQSGNPSGRPKDLVRLGELFTRELFKEVPVQLAGKVVKKSQAEVLVSQMIKQAIAKGGTATRIAPQFMEAHEAREAAREERKAKQMAEGSVEIDWDEEKERAYHDLMARATSIVQATATEDNTNG